jgi:hypothetical protein
LEPELRWQNPSCFLSVTWYREALYGLGVQGVEALIPLGAFFLTSVYSSHHLGSPVVFLIVAILTGVR